MKSKNISVTFIRLYAGVLLVLLIVITFSGCIFFAGSDTGIAVPNLMVKGMPPDITALSLRITGPGMAPVESYYSSVPSSIEIEVPAGVDREFELLAYVTGVWSAFPGYRGTAAADLPPGVTQDLTINMEPTGKIYVANWSSDTVSVIDSETNTVIKTITVGTGPGGVGVSLCCE